MMITRRVVGFVAASLLGVFGQLRAQTMHPLSFHGFVRGCFYVTPTPGTCTPVSTSPFSDTFAGLTYTDQWFGFNTSNTGLGRSDFGEITLTNTVHDYTADNLHLLIEFVFDFPTVANIIFTAAVTGAVTGSPADLVTIDFGPAKAFGWDHGGILNPADLVIQGPISASGPFGPGGASLKLHGVELHGNGTFTVIDPAVTGDLQILASPEPASLFLVGTGLAGVIPLLLRRRRQRS